jgi:hypothetical protein
MTASQLLRLYPRGWRDRYGDEFLATIGDEALRFQQILNIVSGAIDAWLSADVRRSVAGSTQQGVTAMHPSLKALCGTRTYQMTTRDGLIGATVMLLGTAMLVALGILATRSGHLALGEGLKSLSFSVALTLSMPVTFLKGQPWKAQLVICGATLLLLVVATYVATLI